MENYENDNLENIKEVCKVDDFNNSCKTCELYNECVFKILNDLNLM